MKKLFTLVVVVLMVVGAKAQTESRRALLLDSAWKS